MKLLIAPHNDDETLFAGFLIQKVKPDCVVIVYDSYIQVQRGFTRCSKSARREESCQALSLIGVPTARFLGFADSQLADAKEIAQALSVTFPKATEVWAPVEEEGGHTQHNLVASAATAAFGDKIVDRYLMYIRGQGKSTSTQPVEIRPEWIIPKLKALACYRSQIEIPELGCWPWFIESLTEYLYVAETSAHA
jgi:LmbE family N-acetylglucosaminyl deacetylase